MAAIDQILADDPLARVVQTGNFLGYVYSIDYESAVILTNDSWKARVHGVPLNCFLLAATFNPASFSSVPWPDQEVVLLRVVGAARLPQHDDIVRAKIDQFARKEEVFSGSEVADFDAFTLNEIQFGALQARVLGTLYVQDGEFQLGSDIETFTNASRLRVFKPRGEALRTIVNFVDPIRRSRAREDARALGFEGEPEPFRIGTVRYTSTSRLHRAQADDLVPVFIQPSDFLARRTAVFGMTRTGKSNMIKQTVAVVQHMAQSGHVAIGQLIFDVNGEYANPNIQDQGAIAALFPEQTAIYSTRPREGMSDLRNNFFEQLPEGLALLQELTAEDLGAGQADLQTFRSMTLDEPDESEISAHRRWALKCAVYRTLLAAAGFEWPSDMRISFRVNRNVRETVAQNGGPTIDSEYANLSVEDAIEWFRAAQEPNRNGSLRSSSSSSSGRAWLDEEATALVNLLARRNENGMPIRGLRALMPFRDYHSPQRSSEIASEIYGRLSRGEIVILDLSLGREFIRKAISLRIASSVFARSMESFVTGEMPPNIVIYVEEAHNLIGKDAKLDDIWPRIAKEGAKYRIALVYATQEPSSMHANVLANTENWFVTHLNNETEVRQIGRYYDFSDFGQSLLRAQDVGFARVKTLSSPFVVPVQIDLFNVAAWSSTSD